jgi:hypothetical protein
MMEAIADDLPDNDVNGDISSSRDQDAKAEQRRQQNQRNAQAWSKWPQSLCTRDRLFFSYLMVYRASIMDEKRCRTIGAERGLAASPTYGRERHRWIDTISLAEFQ